MGPKPSGKEPVPPYSSVQRKVSNLHKRNRLHIAASPERLRECDRVMHGDARKIANEIWLIIATEASETKSAKRRQVRVAGRHPDLPPHLQRRHPRQHCGEREQHPLRQRRRIRAGDCQRGGGGADASPDSRRSAPCTRRSGPSPRCEGGRRPPRRRAATLPRLGVRQRELRDRRLRGFFLPPFGGKCFSESCSAGLTATARRRD